MQRFPRSPTQVITPIEQYQPSDVERAWLAGMYEGEGSLVAVKRPQRRSIYPSLSVYSTDLDVVQKFGRLVGFGKIHGPYWQRLATKPIWRWNANGWCSIRTFLLLVGEHLCMRRRNRFDEVLSQDPDLTMSQTCGSDSQRGYMQHIRAGESPCRGCRRAHAAHMIEYRDRKNPNRTKRVMATAQNRE